MVNPLIATFRTVGRTLGRVRTGTWNFVRWGRRPELEEHLSNRIRSFMSQNNQGFPSNRFEDVIKYGRVKGVNINIKRSRDPETGLVNYEVGSIGTSYSIPDTRSYGRVIGAVSWGLRKVNAIIDFFRKFAQEFLLVAGFVMFKDFILEETVQTSQFGNFVTLEDIRALNHTLKNNLIALEIAISLRKMMFWNYNQAAFDGFFNTAINTYKSYLLRYALMSQPEIPFLLTTTYKGEELPEVSISFWDEFKYQFTPEEAIQKTVPNENGKFEIKFRKVGYKDVDKLIEVRGKSELGSMNVWEKIYSNLEEELLFSFMKKSSINEILKEDMQPDNKFLWTDYLEDGPLHPLLITKLRQTVYTTKEKKIRNLLEYEYYNYEKDIMERELTTLGKVDDFFDNLKYNIPQNILYLFVSDLVKQDNLTVDYIKQSIDVRIGKINLTNQQANDIIDIINTHSMTKRLIDEADLEYTNWGTYIGTQKYPQVYHSIKEEVTKKPVTFSNDKPSIKNEWQFSFGIHTYFIREHVDDPDFLYLYRSRKLSDLIHPDQIRNLLEREAGQIEWRDITGRSIEWLETNQENYEDPVSKWNKGTKVVLNVEMEKVTDEPMFKMKDVDGVDKDKFINFLIQNVGVNWADNSATFTYKEG